MADRPIVTAGNRSNRVEVRNPVLMLPGAAALRNLDPAARCALAAALRDIQSDARVRAEGCWRKHKAPMAVYWKAVGVYSGHLARALDRGCSDQVSA